ncbi:MAG: hypothetical protein JWO71_1328 [Candidatus Acidoferrum typicum]|nr:hypothetical protein [Candidatus Acidoferrum typicum]
MKTCTAPGHPKCTITCPKGCIAWYREPNGPCKKMCSGHLSEIEISEGDIFSISVQDLPVSDLVSALGKSLPALASLAASSKSVSLSLSSTTLSALNAELQKLL